MSEAEKTHFMSIHPFQANREDSDYCRCGAPREHPEHETGKFSDGYHTVDELYAHRVALWKALCRVRASDDFIWRSRFHSDGSNLPGWFVLGLGWERGEQITYHLPDDEWENCDFARELERAPLFDGHTGKDVLERLNKL